MRLALLDNGDIGLEVSIDNPYIQLIRRPNEEMLYILWRTRYRTSKCEDINQRTKKMQDLLIVIVECYVTWKLYSVEDFRRYKKDIEDMPIRNVEIGKKYGNEYYWIEVYDDTGGDRIPCMCFPASKLINKYSELLTLEHGLETEKNAYFILNNDTKYIFLDVFKIFAAMSVDNKKFIIDLLDELPHYTLMQRFY